MRVGLALASETLKDYIQNYSVDICCVQETLLSEPHPASWWTGPNFWSPAMGT